MDNGTDTRIGDVAQTKSAAVYAGSGTVIGFDDAGSPDFIGFIGGGDCRRGTVEGKYGIDGTGQPENKGRLIYKGGVMTYVVIGANHVYTYHLKYLALTTVGNHAQGYGAYATKAIAVDNEGGQLVVHNGKIRIGDNYITPTYGLSGKIP
jgi:hypothetical protein